MDPLELLPDSSERPQVLQLNCADDVLVIDRGSTTRLDFSRSLPENSLISRVELSTVGGTAVSGIAQLDGGVVTIDTPPGLSRSRNGSEDAYKLRVFLTAPITSLTSDCEVRVRTMSGQPTAFVRAPSPAAAAAASSSYASVAQETDRAGASAIGSSMSAPDDGPEDEDAEEPDEGDAATEEASETPETSQTPEASATPEGTATPSGTAPSVTPTAAATSSPTPAPATATPAPATSTPRAATATPASTSSSSTSSSSTTSTTNGTSVPATATPTATVTRTP
jgi:hypothetical protein